MNTQRIVTSATIVLGGLLMAGCFTRLTTPKETIHYINKDGSLVEPSRAVAIYAPEYMKAVRALSAGLTTSAFRITPGVLLKIQAYGIPQFDQTVNVRPDGILDLPMIGEVVAAGRTIPDLKQEVAEKLSRYYKSPQVIVNAVTPAQDGNIRAGTCTVIAITGQALIQVRAGAAGGGGGGVRQLTGKERLFEVAALSVTGGSAWDQIATIRAGKNDHNLIIISSLENFVRNGEVDENIPVQDGDVIFVPMQENTWIEEMIAGVRVVNAVAGDIDALIDLGLKDRTKQ